MLEPIAYLNGEMVSISEAKLSVFDLGLVHGASVTEMVRTFGHRPFHLEAHLERLYRSVKAVQFPFDMPQSEMANIVNAVVDHNKTLIPDRHDLGIVLFVTAGLNLTYVGAAGSERCRQPTVCIHTFPLPFELWAHKFSTGQHLVTPSVRHIPPASLDPKIKSRSRLHFYLADQQARLVDSQAGALMLDQNAWITETTSGNFFLVTDGKILTPGGGNALGGVSQMVVENLAERVGLEYRETDLRSYDVQNAEEAFTSSTPYCLLPVTRFNGQPIGDGRPGPVFGKLVQAWNDLVGLDIIQQMQTGAVDRQTDPSQAI